MLKRFMEVLKDEEGATMVEYALMVALIAIVAIAGVTLLGKAVNNNFTDTAGKIAPTPAP